MLSSAMKCGLVINKYQTANRIAQSTSNIGRRKYVKDNKDACCKDIVQTKDSVIEPWPKTNVPPPTCWRPECPSDPQPVNYDPYRIKLPNIVVPPLPPSNAKWIGVVLSTGQRGEQNQGPAQGPDPQQQGVQEEVQEKEEETKENFLDFLKRLFGKGKKGGSDSGNTLIPMLDCTKTKGPCSVQPPKSPPCPPPPPPQFPWIYVCALASFFGFMGVVYRLYLWNEEQNRFSESTPIWRPRPKVKYPYHDSDLPACVQYLIIGTGAAGWAAYRAIMEHDSTAKVFFITNEDALPYRRPPMSKHMWWNPDPPDLKNLEYVEDGKVKTMYVAEQCKFMDPVKFYRKKSGPAVSLASGWCVLRVDPDNHVAYVKTLCGERPIYYERCLLAPGSKPKNINVFTSAPKVVRDRVTTFRSIRDFEIAYRKVKAAKHVVIIGGGSLGTELAWHLGRMNKLDQEKFNEEPIKIVQIFKDKGIMANVLPEYLGEWAAEKIKCEGVTVMPKTQVYDAFESKDGRVELTLSNGTSLITDYVLLAVGTEPRIELAEPSFLEVDSVNGGFLVNTELEAKTHLYVAGDAASFYSQWKDTRIRTEHYDNAEEQGYVAGANMTGYWVPSNMEPHYWLVLGDALEMQVVGEVGACMPTVALFKPCNEETGPRPVPVSHDGERPCYKKTDEYQNRYKRGMLFYLRDETVVGMVFWNFPSIENRKEVVTEMLRARPTYRDINLLAELLGFPELRCVYVEEEKVNAIGPCIKNWREF